MERVLFIIPGHVYHNFYNTWHFKPSGRRMSQTDSQRYPKGTKDLQNDENC